MTKFTKFQREEIVTLKLQGVKVKDLMDKFGISKPMIYKIMKENDVEFSEVNTNIDIDEIQSDDDIFEELNENIKQKKEVDIIEKVDNIIELPQSRPPSPTLPQIQSMNIPTANLAKVNSAKLESLKLLDIAGPSKPRLQNNVMEAPKQNIRINKDPTLSEEYPDIQNTMNVIKRYIDTYYETGKLDDIIGHDKRLFVLRLNELDLYQLRILLSNIQFKLASSNSSKLFETGFFLASQQIETATGFLGYDCNGLTQALKQNDEVGECLKELSCKYDVTKYVSPESRLIMAVATTAYGIHSNNNIKVKFNNFLSQPVDEKIQNNFKNL